MKHSPTYEVCRDPEGNSWTVTCSAGDFQESASTRKEARHEWRSHRERLRQLEESKS